MTIRPNFNLKCYSTKSIKNTFKKGHELRTNLLTQGNRHQNESIMVWNLRTDDAYWFWHSGFAYVKSISATDIFVTLWKWKRWLWITLFLPVAVDPVHTVALVLARIWTTLIGVNFTPTSFKSWKIDEMVMDRQAPPHPENVRADDNKGPSECHFNGTSSPCSISHLPALSTHCFPFESV